MKIKRLLLANIKSFDQECEVLFNSDFSILVGPNGSGKSNLLDIVTILFRQFFLYGYDENRNQSEAGIFTDINRQNTFGDISNQLEKFIGNTNDSVISVTFELSDSDIVDMQMIYENIDLLEEKANELYRNYPNQISNVRNWDLSGYKTGLEMTYEIRNCSIHNLQQNSHESMFLEHLNHFEFFRILTNSVDGFSFHSIYLYVCPYRSANNTSLQGNLSERSFQKELLSLAKSTSKSTSSLLQLATLYFAEKRRAYEDQAHEKGYLELWNSDEEVKLVSKYLKKLGYDWDLILVDKNRNIYEINLERDGSSLNVSQASSGEKEILNFLLGVFAFNVKGGIIVIDEPELHLHPRWQIVLLSLFTELSSVSENQFVICTHSSSFINENSFRHLIRVFRNDASSSSVVLLDASRDQIEMRDLVQLVNGTNNEKIFFADAVLLVEGVTDRLVFQRIFRDKLEELGISKVIEIVETKGKGNREKFSQFLEKLGVCYAFLGDLDVVCDLESKQISSLFQVDMSKIEKDVIRNSKSKDGTSLAHQLEVALSTKSTDDLESLWHYIKSFRTKLKADMSSDETQSLNNFIDSKASEGIFILREGDIEIYFPKAHQSKSLDNVLKLLNEENYQAWKKDSAARFDQLSSMADLILAFLGVIRNKT